MQLGYKSIGKTFQKKCEEILHCAECVDENLFLCKTCNDGYYLKKNSCFESCLKDESCKECDPNDLSICLECESNYVSNKNSECVEQNALNLRSIVIDEACSNEITNCLICILGENTICEKCSSEFILFENSCLTGDEYEILMLNLL